MAEQQEAREIQDPEVALMNAMVKMTTAKGVGPKSAHDLATAFEAIAEPIAALVQADPTNGPDQVRRVVSYIRSRTGADLEKANARAAASAEPVKAPKDKATPAEPTKPEPVKASA